MSCDNQHIMDLLDEQVSLKAENGRLLADSKLLLIKLSDEHAARQSVEAENAKLRDALKALMMGTYAELCTERDESQCKECSMGGESDDSCLVADACEVLGIDMYGEPLGIEVQ